jgi:hypothetical protein
LDGIPHHRKENLKSDFRESVIRERVNCQYDPMKVPIEKRVLDGNEHPHGDLKNYGWKAR